MRRTRSDNGVLRHRERLRITALAGTGDAQAGQREAAIMRNETMRRLRTSSVGEAFAGHRDYLVVAIGVLLLWFVRWLSET